MGITPSESPTDRRKMPGRINAPRPRICAKKEAPVPVQNQTLSQISAYASTISRLALDMNNTRRAIEFAQMQQESINTRLLDLNSKFNTLKERMDTVQQKQNELVQALNKPPNPAPARLPGLPLAAPVTNVSPMAEPVVKTTLQAVPEMQSAGVAMETPVEPTMCGAADAGAAGPNAPDHPALVPDAPEQPVVEGATATAMAGDQEAGTAAPVAGAPIHKTIAGKIKKKATKSFKKKATKSHWVSFPDSCKCSCGSCDAKRTSKSRCDMSTGEMCCNACYTRQRRGFALFKGGCADATDKALTSTCWTNQRDAVKQAAKTCVS
jgi:hypothetical protein